MKKAQVTAGSDTWNLSNPLTIGSSTHGRLEVKGGATVKATDTVDVGVSSTGELLVDGVGSSFITEDLLSIGTAPDTSSPKGKGLVEVTNGGSLTANRMYINESGAGSTV